MGITIKASLSARRAWIEITSDTGQATIMRVALRKESVDRNIPEGALGKTAYGSLSARRAWIEIWWLLASGSLVVSLSARRAWIEIVEIAFARLVSGVALRKESVDRNTNFSPANLFDLPSLSARRAWIEIPLIALFDFPVVVALRKESVDRNKGDQLQNGRNSQSLSARRAWIEIRNAETLNVLVCCRSPQGERG